MKRIITAMGLAAILVTIASSQDARPASPSLLKPSFGKLPIYFIENRGVYPDEVEFYVQGADKTLFFTREGITFRLKGKEQGWVVKLEFVGANPDVILRGENKQQAVFSYFKGPEKDWKTGLPTFSRIVYENLWPGIDLVYRAEVGALKYEFLVASQADPAKIRLRYRGASSVRRTGTGALEVETPAGGFEDAPPEAWQEIEGERVPVEMAYAVSRDGFHGFNLGEYDTTRPLVLDPVILVSCGYIGGTREDEGHGVSMDVFGNAYVTGCAYSDERTFPVTLGPDLTYNGGTWDAFVAKVNASGSALVYCGYIGGAGADYGDDVAVDAVGNAHVAGTTESTEQTFPVTLGPDLTFNLGFLDIFVAKVNTKGTGLVYCGYIGGDRVDHSPSVSVDGSGNVFVTGITLSHQFSFPVKVGPSLSHGGGVGDAFAAKVVLTLLEGSGTIRPGGTVTLNLTSTDDIGLPYQVGSSLGTGPISIDTRQLNLSPDDLLTVSVAGLWPTIFSGYRGLIDNQGQAKAGINIPNDRVLIGFRLHTAFVTLDPQALSGIKSISNTFFFSITK